ncbi:MAG: hypothetical protein H6741_14430 [Alphaproteobacteria bacterium]|nr:hypothetical protein [Alphaproteobacteria bacterium]
MEVLVLTAGLMGLAMVGMALGVILSDKRLKGSCGGPGSSDCICDIEKQRACARLKALQKQR